MKEAKLYNDFYEKVNTIWVPMAKAIIKLKNNTTKEMNKQIERMQNPENYCQGNYTINKASWLLVPLWPILAVKKEINKKHYEEEKNDIVSNARKRYAKVNKKYNDEIRLIVETAIEKIKPIVEEYDFLNLKDTMLGVYIVVKQVLDSKRVDTVKEALLYIDDLKFKNAQIRERRKMRKEANDNYEDVKKKMEEFNKKLNDIRENTRHPSDSYYDD